MTQKQKAQKQPRDPYAQRGKALTSAVQRLRGWVGSDPSRLPELADALVQLTEHRLLGHAYAAAAADAQEAVRLAAQLLTANGPIGPYTSSVDAARCITAMVHVATVQVGVGRPEAARQTIESVHHLQQQLRDVGVAEQLTPQTDVWARSCAARATLTSADVATANAHADAALARVRESGLVDDADAAYLAIDAERLVSDCRWAAGRVEEALSHLHLAQNRYDEVVAGRLQEPGRLSPALLERLAEPLFGLYRDLADRLRATGELDHALATRRTLVELLQGLAGRLGETARVQLASSLADLADDLLTAGRVDEAITAATQATETTHTSPGARSAQLIVAAVHARALTRAGRSDEAVTLLRSLAPAEAGSAADALALDALAAVLRAESELDAAGMALQDLARGVVSRGRHPAAGADEVVAEELTPEQHRETAAWLEAERVEAHRLEEERLEQARIEAERREAERIEAERVAAEQLAVERAEAERAAALAAERQAAAEEAERLAVKRRREERLEAHRLEVERLEAERLEAERLEVERAAAERLAADPAEAERVELERLRVELAELAVTGEQDELLVAQQEWRDARARGDRRAARAANERVVELLRPRARLDATQYGWQLVQALEDLSSARLRSGDVWGSRAPAREAKALARTLGR